MLTALAAGLLTHKFAGNVIAGVAAAVTLYFVAPIILARSGVAYDSLIALCFLLWALYFLSRFMSCLSIPDGVLSGLFFGCTAASRPDYTPAAVLFILVVTARIAWLRWQGKTAPAPFIAGSAMGSVIASMGVVSIFVANFVFTGSPFKSAYPQDSWLGSTSSVVQGFVTIRVDDFIQQSQYFLWQIAEPTLPLFIGGGLVLLISARRLDPALVILVGISAFIAVLHLSRTGAHNSDGPYLNSSVPRYLLPVYASAVVIGFTGLSRSLSWRHFRLIGPAVVLSVCLLASVWGIREAYKGSPGIPAIEATLARMRLVHEFSTDYTDAVFVGDHFSKAVIVTPRTLIPRLIKDQARLSELVAGQLIAKRRVFIVHDRSFRHEDPYYSGYVEGLIAAGFAVCPIDFRGLRLAEVFDPTVESDLIRETLIVPADIELGVQTGRLEVGRAYYLISQGSFINSSTGNRSDSAHLLVDGSALRGSGGADLHCFRAEGRDEALRLSVADDPADDNKGFLTVVIREIP